MSLPKPMEEVTGWLLLLLFSFRTSSSLDRSSRLSFFLLFFFLCRGGSFLGKVNMGKMTSSMAKAQSRKPLHLQGDRRRSEPRNLPASSLPPSSSCHRHLPACGWRLTQQLAAAAAADSQHLSHKVF